MHKEFEYHLMPIRLLQPLSLAAERTPPDAAVGRSQSCTCCYCERLNRMAGLSPSAKAFAPKQRQYLAVLHFYTRLHRRAPAEADMQKYFRVSLPSVHQIVRSLEAAGAIKRPPRGARRIELLVDLKTLPELI